MAKKKKIKVVARYSKPGDGGMDDEAPAEDDEFAWDVADAVADARASADEVEASVRAATARADRAEGELAAAVHLLEQIEERGRDDAELADLDDRIGRLRRELADLADTRVDVEAPIRRRAELRRLAYDALETEIEIEILEEMSDRDLMVAVVDLAGVGVSQGRSDAYVEAMFRAVTRSDAGDWEEDKHPRGEHGMFGSGGGSGGGGGRSSEKSSSKSVTHESISREQIKAVEARAIADKNTGLRDAARTALESGSSQGQRAALDRVVAHVNGGGQEHPPGGRHTAESITHEQIRAVEAQAIADKNGALRDAVRTVLDPHVSGSGYAQAIDKVVAHVNGGTNSVAINHKVPQPRAERAARLTASAEAATARANASGSKGDHDRAAVLHGQAMSEHRALGTGSKYHAQHYENHANKGSGLTAHVAAVEASHSAEVASDRGSHAAAASAHAAAARANTTIGASDAVKYHEGKAAEHGKAGAPAGSSTGGSMTGAEKAAEATRIARERQAALAERLAKSNARGRGRKKRGDDWEEDKHPRANDGKFGEGGDGGDGGDGGGASESESRKIGSDAHKGATGAAFDALVKEHGLFKALELAGSDPPRGESSPSAGKERQRSARDPEREAAIIDESAAANLVTAGAGEHPDLGPEKHSELKATRGRSIDKFVGEKGDTRYVLSVKGQRVAALHVKSKDGKTATIETVYTAPEFRRQGLANALLKVASSEFDKVKHAEAGALTKEGKSWKNAQRGEKANKSKPKAKRGDADWEEDKHPRANDGKFGAGGSSGEPKVTERAASSVKNSEFVGKHRDRLVSAADAYRNSLPAEVNRGSDEVHNKAQQEIHHEAERIHREQDAMTGPHAERLQRAVDNLKHDKTSSPDAKHEAALKAIADEHKSIADEHAAVAAGHVEPIHEDKLNEFRAGKAEFEHEVGKMSTELHEQQQAALTAVADFEAVHEATVDPGESTGEAVIDTNMHDAYESSSQTFDDALGGKGRELNTDPTREYDQLEHVEKPDKSDDPGKWDEKKVIEDSGYSAEDIAGGALDDAKAEHDQQAADYQERVAAYDHFQRELKVREAAVKPAAVKAQVALEELHAHQVASLARAMELDGKASSGLDAISKELENVGVKEGAFDHHAQHEDGTFTDPKVQADYERAHAAAESLRSEYDQQIESTRYGFEEDSLSSLKEAIKETAAAAKQLSKYTGRQPTLEKPAKKARKK